jgi:GGDEF domain-containing protein
MRQEHRPGTSGLDGNDSTAGMTRGLLLLLEALACHAIDYDYDECSTYQREIRETREKLENATDARTAVALTAEAIDLVRNQNQEIDRFMRSLAAEKQAIIHLISESLLKVCTRSDTTAQNLRALEKELAKAFQLKEIRTLKPKIAEALDAICREAEGQEQQLLELQPAIAALGRKPVAVDTVTGLPGMDEAEAAFKEFARAGRPAYVVALTVRNLDVVNRRVSFAAGNKLLMLFSQEIAQRLSGNDRLFRWRGPCFVAVLPRETGLALVRQEAAKFGTISQERTIEDNHSSIFFKMSTAWRLFPVPRASEVAELSNQIDAFLVAQPHADLQA